MQSTFRCSSAKHARRNIASARGNKRLEHVIRKSRRLAWMTAHCPRGDPHILRASGPAAKRRKHHDRGAASQVITGAIVAVYDSLTIKPPQKNAHYYACIDGCHILACSVQPTGRRLGDVIVRVSAVRVVRQPPRRSRQPPRARRGRPRARRTSPRPGAASWAAGRWSPARCAGPDRARDRRARRA